MNIETLLVLTQNLNTNICFSPILADLFTSTRQQTIQNKPALDLHHHGSVSHGDVDTNTLNIVKTFLQIPEISWYVNQVQQKSIQCLCEHVMKLGSGSVCMYSVVYKVLIQCHSCSHWYFVLPNTAMIYWYSVEVWSISTFSSNYSFGIF